MNQPPRSSLRLIPAILAGLILRRTGAVSRLDRAAAKGLRNGSSNHDEASDHDKAWDYEHSDVEAAKTAWAMLGLAGAVLVTIAAVLALNLFVLGRQRAALPPLTARQVTAIRPPPPNLQADPYVDIGAKEADEAARLSAYAYLDAARTRARIPIARAMALMAGRPFDPEPGTDPEAHRAPAP
jgi:hypothetical protein